MPKPPPPAAHCQWTQCFLPPEYRIGTSCPDHGMHVDDYCSRHYREVKVAAGQGAYLCGEPSKSDPSSDCDQPMKLSEPIEIRKIVTA